MLTSKKILHLNFFIHLLEQITVKKEIHNFAALNVSQKLHLPLSLKE